MPVGKPNCKTCGIAKTVENTYVLRKTDWNSECKRCTIERAKRLNVTNATNLNKSIPDLVECPRCNKTLNSSMFPKNRTTKTGLCRYCKKCSNQLGSEQARANPSAYNARAAKRRGIKLSATPSWVDYEKINQVYLEASKLTELTGIVHECDHDHPLQGTLINGFHIHTNLVVLPKSENRSKHNRFTPYRIDSTGQKYELRGEDWVKV